jgi:hypothetical protein
VKNTLATRALAGVRDFLPARLSGWDHVLMDQDDPEKRIAELERQHTEAAGQARRDQALHLNPDSPHKEGRSQKRWSGVVRSVLVLVAVTLVPFGAGEYEFHAYRVGTPTTATNVHCVRGSRTLQCTGAWSVGGESHSGKIIGVRHFDGSTLDVRVRGDTAYTPDAGHRSFQLATIMAIIAAVLLVIRLAQALGGRSGS